MSGQPPLPAQEMVNPAGPQLRPAGPRPAPPQIQGPPRPFLPGGPLSQPPRGPAPRPSGPHSIAQQPIRPPQPQQPQSLQNYPGNPVYHPGQPQSPAGQHPQAPHPGPPQPGQFGPRGPPGLPGPPRHPAPPQQHNSVEKQQSFQQPRPPAPPLGQISRQGSLASLGPAADPAVTQRRPMDPDNIPPAVKNRSFSIAGPPGAFPGGPLHDEDRRRSISTLGGLPEAPIAKGPGLAFIKEGVPSFDKKESPLNIGLTKLSKEDDSKGSRESVKSDTSETKLDRPESRLSGSKMTESIMGSLDSDDRKNGSPSPSGKRSGEDDLVAQNNRANSVSPAQHGTPNKSVSPNLIQENGFKPTGPAPMDRSPSLTSSSPEQKLTQSKMDSPNRPASVSSTHSKTPEPEVKPISATTNNDFARPPSVQSNKSDVRVDTPEPKTIIEPKPVPAPEPKASPEPKVTPEPKATPEKKISPEPKTSPAFKASPEQKPSPAVPEKRNDTPDSQTGRPASRVGVKPTDFASPIRAGTEERKPVTRKAASAPKTRREGDNDSGVDESTQGNDHVNGSPGSPGKKSPSKIPGLKTQAIPHSGGSGGRSVVRSPNKSAAAAHTPNTPDSTASNTSIEKKKLPMNHVQVGAAPSPNIKSVKSKIGSLANTTHKPGGGKVKIENRKLDFNNATPRIAAKNETYHPGGGDKKITQKKLQWNATSKIGSLENATHKPGGGDKKIETVKLDFKDKAKPKVASTVNITHKPGGGDVKFIRWPLRRWRASGKHFPLNTVVKIENQKLDIKAHSKVGSLDNVKHKPGGGDVKIFDDKEYLKQIAAVAPDGAHTPISESPVPSSEHPPISDENLNRES